MNWTYAIRLISVDLDGTLFRSDSTPAPESVRLLQCARQAGVRVVINTTRNIGGVRKLCKVWGFRDPVICTNGAQIFASPEGASVGVLHDPDGGRPFCCPACG